MTRQGLVIVFTGEGKGKTSAAMGIAMRASGHKMYVSVIQFIKHPQAAGEARAAERLVPQIEFLALGKGFVNKPESPVPLNAHKNAAESALEKARQQIASGSWDVVILDEINTAVSLGLLDIVDVLNLVKGKPSKLHLILTGRGAHPALIETADLVTEMRPIKHPYDRGVPAQQGIDY